MKYSLYVLWRSEGEQILNFRTKREAEDHMDQLELHFGDRIIKMAIGG